MATITAAAGGGNWSSNASWVGGVKPGASDDVLLASTSGNITIDISSACRSLNCTGYTHTLVHNSSAILSIGDPTAGLSNIALKFVATMGYTPVSQSAEIDFVSTSATQQTIDYGGFISGIVRFIAPGASYLISTAMTVGAGLNIQAGTINFNSLSHTASSLSATTSGTKTITLGSSTITLNATGGSGILNLTGAVTFTANTATFIFTGASTGPANSLGAINLNGASIVFATTVVTAFVPFGLTMANLTMSGVTGKGASLTISGSTTVTGTVTVSGSSATNRPLLSSGTSGTVTTVTAAAFSFSNVDFQDVTAAGAGGTWTGTSMGNCLGNTNITFDTPTTQTNTGTTGNWSDVTKWTSRVPLPQDNVVINTGSGTISTDMPRLGANIDFTGFTGVCAMNIASFALVFGDWKFGSGMSTTGSAGAITFAGRGAQTITSVGIVFPAPVSLGNPYQVIAPGGTYTCVDDIVFTGALSRLTVISGTFSGSTHNVTAGSFNEGSGSNARGFSGSGTWTITDASTSGIFLSGVGTNVTIAMSSATIVFSVAGSSARTFNGRGNTYGTLTYTIAGSTGSLTITGSNTFNAINFSDATNARSLLFTAGTTTTVTNFNVNGTLGKLMTVDSATAATHTLTNPSSGFVSSDYLNVAHSIATGGGGWYAGAHSTDGGSDTGWIFTAAQDPSFFAVF